ncbi:MAG: 2-amino-4-hydroxy-6-hydroxymethyldihydropteridine diphosphokinase [Muribaculaceae bacterium]|nr:2-amino-4-hydroxy-6-hydroxymethyldihydropteridine diphosphokinase [Muribaculaceae bacterium]
MIVYINIGSNLGDRRLNLSRAVSKVHKAFGPFHLSHSVESDPWGYDSPHRFLNIGMAFRSDLEPLEILHTLQAIEREISPASHRRTDGSYADRLIDIDIMAITDENADGTETPLTIDSPELTVPHPHLQERPFFLDPLRELIECQRENTISTPSGA